MTDLGDIPVAETNRCLFVLAGLIGFFLRNEPFKIIQRKNSIIEFDDPLLAAPVIRQHINRDIKGAKRLFDLVEQRDIAAAKAVDRLLAVADIK